MALALLCSRIQRHGMMKLKCTALVVDHKLRDGSTEEAERTRQRLAKLGLTARKHWNLGSY